MIILTAHFGSKTRTTTWNIVFVGRMGEFDDKDKVEYFGTRAMAV